LGYRLLLPLGLVGLVLWLVPGLAFTKKSTVVNLSTYSAYMPNLILTESGKREETAVVWIPSQVGIAIPDVFSNPGISGLKNANPGIPGLNPGIESLILN